jgi:catechol 2,3-dioxygenase-like lactoylglutathione lyase family enzyme
MKLARVILHVRSPDNLARFYVERLGMTLLSRDKDIVVGYGGGDAAIALRRAEKGRAYVHRRDDRYWKIGITLPNVDIAVAQLRAAGMTVSEPSQFQDIGYMAHLQDPEGFVIELLQHEFGSKRSADAGDPQKLLGGGGRVGQITLRTHDLEASLAFYRDRLGMSLLSVQPVPDYGFTLYFLAFTEERPPLGDLESVGNREWLWQRPYTTLELQHVSVGATGFALPDAGAPGFAGIVVTDAAGQAGDMLDDAGGLVECLA